MLQRATDSSLRRLLALLTVVAAFAFQMRAGGMATLPSPQPPRTAQMAGHAMTQAPTVPAAVPGVPVQGSHRESESHNHGAHCPFCVTGAFALEAGVLPLPNGPPVLSPQVLLSTPGPRPAALRHADARAPPFLL
ncbi:hypothetical protein [Deinococcus humi]|nr:hypothetical protein [Deinococcus humi]GGO31458.1 hypothetical protein GCM10008949_27510 [Deinococcus humi]